MKLKTGTIFIHSRWLDSEYKPLRCKVTASRKGLLYYRPFYGYHDDGTEWLGAPSYFGVDQIKQYVKSVEKY